MKPRGTLVFDVGATNTKLVLFDADGRPVMERKVPSAHVNGPVYRSIDIDPALLLFRETLASFDAALPVDAIVPSTHGSSLALMRADGSLALPIMFYQTEPPDSVFADYAKIAPCFAETLAPTNPMALTLGLQLMWQEQAFPKEFAQVRTIVPLPQYFACRLGGEPRMETTSLGAQTHLWDPTNRRYSSLAKARGWDKLFAPMSRAYDTLGTIAGEMRPSGMRGQGAIKSGIHDSNANYLRYLASGIKRFTLLSTGTWIIIFDTDADASKLNPALDTAANVDIFARPVACSRYMGGHEIAAVEAGAAPNSGTVEHVAKIVSQRTFPVPTFTRTGGPMPGTGGRGRVDGPAPETAAERSALASLYCALMTDQSLNAVGSTADIIVDGPFSQNPVFIAVLAQLRSSQNLLVSDLRDGTTAGAALLGAMETESDLPRRPIDLSPVEPTAIQGLDAYRAEWLELARRNAV